MASDESRLDVTIGDVSGSTFAIGDHAHAESHHGTTAPREEDIERLLDAIRELRADLGRTRATPQTADLDAALADAEDEITRTGNPGRSRLQRLRELLTDAESLTAVLASAATLAGLLGT
ncbi:hypothetical protein H0H10_00320 [Streptomyces sp. TRM S81-3]|uniref:Uncharacterized protein n=1 Tax=Streptomyces griseicoloratus TaxID=2752516 RepID=A0A926KX99_9ACTN|nr:hypothetical protein [Streptomyces griseicoloratus]MBD0417646.1 hypothetical protein [Streptomyces griseicoloratus]